MNCSRRQHSFRVLAEEVLHAPADDAEFGLRVELKFVGEDEEEGDEDDVAESTAGWGAFGFMFALNVLSFADAKPRNASVLEYEEEDEFRLTDFIERLRFARGELRFDADYIRGRRIKTRIAIGSSGTVTLETIGRGKAAVRWLEQLQGKQFMQLVSR